MNNTTKTTQEINEERIGELEARLREINEGFDDLVLEGKDVSATLQERRHVEEELEARRRARSRYATEQARKAMLAEAEAARGRLEAFRKIRGDFEKRALAIAEKIKKANEEAQTLYREMLEKTPAATNALFAIKNIAPAMGMAISATTGAGIDAHGCVFETHGDGSAALDDIRQAFNQAESELSSEAESATNAAEAARAS